jgi:hypothetical protein
VRCQIPESEVNKAIKKTREALKKFLTKAEAIKKIGGMVPVVADSLKFTRIERRTFCVKYRKGGEMTLIGNFDPHPQ